MEPQPNEDGFLPYTYDHPHARHAACMAVCGENARCLAEFGRTANTNETEETFLEAYRTFVDAHRDTQIGDGVEPGECIT